MVDAAAVTRLQERTQALQGLDGSNPDNQVAVARAAQIESVQAALERRARGGPRPAHYIPVADISDNT